MNTHDTRKPSLDGVLDGIRRDDPTRAEIAAAAGRVRAALGFSAPEAIASAIHIEDCAGFQALIPEYVAGRLERPTALLLDDHSRECIPCRRALMAARRPDVAGTGHLSGGRRSSVVRWAMAASVAAVGLLGAYTAWNVLPGLTGGADAKVISADGSLFQVAGEALVPLQAGMTVKAGSVVRTAKDSRAMLQLEDGSRIEMRDRTEFAVAGRRGGSTLRLGNGSIIVEASPQGRGHLDVATDDCLVSVKGTIFSVSRGTKGSRVSVVEGSVEMDAGGSERLLRSGDQATTSEALDAVPVSEEIAWSRDSARYGELLRELASLRRDLDARIPNPKLRYGSKLLARMPQETVVYASIPNITDAILEARKVFMEHVAESETLQAWWNQHMSSPEKQREMDEAFAQLRQVGGQLGEEIVVALALDREGKVRGPMVTAEVKDLRAFRRALLDAAKGVDSDFEVLASVDDSIVTLEPKREHKERASLSGFDFRGNPFHDRLAVAYRDGVSWLFGADLHAMIDRAAIEARKREDGQIIASSWEKMGLLDARYLIAERDESDQGATMHADLTFDGPRRGIAGWLAEPGPLGALEFVSPDASFATAGVIKRPEALLTEAMSWVQPHEGHLLEHLERIRDESGVDLLRDVAGSLGGDVAFAVDGPILPTPSWKLAIEVYDAARLQRGIEGIARWSNERLEREGRTERVVLGTEEAGNRTDWVMRFNGSAPEGMNVFRYTHVDGYLLAAPSRILLDRAIEQRGGGYSLSRSAAFTRLLPRDGQVDVSALVWQNFGPSLGPLAARMAGVIADQRIQDLNAFATDLKPQLVTFSAGENSITVSARGEEGFGSILGSVVSLNQLQLLSEALHEPGEKEPADPTK